MNHDLEAKFQDALALTTHHYAAAQIDDLIRIWLDGHRAGYDAGKSAVLDSLDTALARPIDYDHTEGS